MHKLNGLMEEVKEGLWEIKRYRSPIGLKDLTDFYREYSACANLVLDALNAQVIQYDGSAPPFSDEEADGLIGALAAFQQYRYDRLTAETLFVLDRPHAYEYLARVLEREENRRAFVRDFQRFSHFEHVREELSKLGVRL